MSEPKDKKPKEYTRILSPGMSEPIEVISFEPESFIEVKSIKMSVEDSEYVEIIDINKYKVDVVKLKAKACYETLKGDKLAMKVLNTKRKFHAAFPTYYDICPEYEDSFRDFMK